MEFFSIDFSTLINQLLPVRLRKIGFIAWLQCITKPVVSLYEKFTNNRIANNYYLAHNGQVCHLEGILSNRFEDDFAIRNGPYADAVYVFQYIEYIPVHVALEAELTPTPPDYDAPVYLFTDAAIYNNVGVPFRVYFPEGASYTPDEFNEMTGLIDRYRLPGVLNYEVLEGPAPPLSDDLDF